jgi:hypothetical protein
MVAQNVGISVAAAPLTCPANSMPDGAGCRCNPNYRTSAAGNSCVVYPGDIAHIAAQGAAQTPNSCGGCHLPAVFPPN